MGGTGVARNRPIHADEIAEEREKADQRDRTGEEPGEDLGPGCIQVLRIETVAVFVESGESHRVVEVEHEGALSALEGGYDIGAAPAPAAQPLIIERIG